MADDQLNHDALITQLAGLTGIAPQEVSLYTGWFFISQPSC